MPDIQISDPYTNKPTFYKYDSNDRQLLVDLLHEYSTKLANICDDLLVVTNLQKSYSYTISLSSLLIILVMANRWVEEIYFGINVNRLPINFILQTGAFLIAFILIAKLLSSFPFFKSYSRSIAQKRLFERDATIIAEKLEKVMRVTIEIQDQIETNLSRKLELDLRIADAQSALEYYYSVFTSKSSKRA